MIYSCVLPVVLVSIVLVCVVVFLVLPVGKTAARALAQLADGIGRATGGPTTLVPGRASAQGVVGCANLRGLSFSATIAATRALLDVCNSLHAASQGAPYKPPGFAADWTRLDSADLPFFGACGRYETAPKHGGEAFFMIVFRGTATHKELLDNDLGTKYLRQRASKDIAFLIDRGVPMPYPPQIGIDGSWTSTNKDPRVNAAFYFSYVGDEVEKKTRAAVSAQLKTGALPLIVGGHSLGAGVACVCAALLLGSQHPPLAQEGLHLLNAATPKPGNAAFRALLDSATGTTCFANECDLIPFLPTSVVPDFSVDDGADAAYEYVLAPGTCIFSVPGATLVDCHSAESYRKGLDLLEEALAPTPPPTFSSR
jgi:hypothetical protein